MALSATNRNDDTGGSRGSAPSGLLIALAILAVGLLITYAVAGALRAQATDVDLTPRSHGRGKFQEEGIVTAVTLAERIAPSMAKLRVAGAHLSDLMGMEVAGMPLSKPNLPIIRGKVGLVFQSPDDQLFSPTVFEDVAFGPLHMGLPEAEVEGLCPDDCLKEILAATEVLSSAIWRVFF